LGAKEKIKRYKDDLMKTCTISTLHDYSHLSILCNLWMEITNNHPLQ